MTEQHSRQQGRRPDHTAAVPARYALSQDILQIARQSSHRIGLSGEEVEDCAMAFIGRMLLDDTEETLRPPDQRHRMGTYSPVWVGRCTLNHARNFKRHRMRINLKETSWSQMELSEEVLWGYPENAEAADPETSLLRNEVTHILQESIERLAAGPRTFVLRHHIAAEHVYSISADSGRTPHAVEQALVRARQRLRTILERQGIETETIQLYLSFPKKLFNHLEK